MLLLEVKCLLYLIFGHGHGYPHNKTITVVLQAYFKLVFRMLAK